MFFDFAHRIIQLRSDLEFTSNQLANKSGLSQSYICKLERGQSSPSLRTLELICAALSVNLREFFLFPQYSANLLRVIKLLENLSDDQLDALYILLSPQYMEGH